MSKELMDLRDAVRKFAEERDWDQFHSPKNLATALTVESGELLEHFQWLTVEESRAVVDQPHRLADVGEELADVICYALALANELKLDLSQIVRDKMAKNEAKYPADEFRGRFGTDDTH